MVHTVTSALWCCIIFCVNHSIVIHSPWTCPIIRKFVSFLCCSIQGCRSCHLSASPAIEVMRVQVGSNVSVHVEALNERADQHSDFAATIANIETTADVSNHHCWLKKNAQVSNAPVMTPSLVVCVPLIGRQPEGLRHNDTWENPEARKVVFFKSALQSLLACRGYCIKFGAVGRKNDFTVSTRWLSYMRFARSSIFKRKGWLPGLGLILSTSSRPFAFAHSFLRARSSCRKSSACCPGFIQR